MSTRVASHVVVGDIGGTNARLSLWTQDKPGGGAREAAMLSQTFSVEDHAEFKDVFVKFLEACNSKVGQGKVKSAALAVAGAVSGNYCKMTNTRQWVVDGGALSSAHGFPVRLLNDFEAVGYGIPELVPGKDYFEVQGGAKVEGAPICVMGPGTGLGAAQLVMGTDGYTVVPGEGAHATFAPRGWKQRALADFARDRLRAEYLRRGEGDVREVEIEQVACGSGLQLIYDFLYSDEVAHNPDVLRGGPRAKTPKDVTSLAEAGDPVAAEACRMLMAIVGAEAGNMALRCLARGGVYIGGGITPKLTANPEAEARGREARKAALLEGFRAASSARPAFHAILATIPLYVVTEEAVGQLGALAYARKTG